MLSKKLRSISNKFLLSASLITVLSVATPDIKASSSLSQNELSNRISQLSYKYPKVEPQKWASILIRYCKGDPEARDIMIDQGTFIPTKLIRDMRLEGFTETKIEQLLRTSPTESYLILNNSSFFSTTLLHDEEKKEGEAKLKAIIEDMEKNGSQNPYAIGRYYNGNCRYIYEPRDSAKALLWLMRAAEQGFAPAQNDLGDMYEYGKGVRKNHSQAFQWYKQAADQGFPEAQLSLGHYYQHGLSVDKNKSRAVEWYMKAMNSSGKMSWLVDLIEPAYDSSPLPADAQNATRAFFEKIEDSISKPITFLRAQNDPEFPDNTGTSELLFQRYDLIVETFNLLNDVYQQLDQPGFMVRNFEKIDGIAGMTPGKEDISYILSFPNPFTNQIYISFGEKNVQASVNLMKFCQVIADQKQDIQESKDFYEDLLNIYNREIALSQENPVGDLETQQQTIISYRDIVREAETNISAFSSLLKLPETLFNEIERLISIRHQKHQQEILELQSEMNKFECRSEHRYFYNIKRTYKG